MADDIQLLPGGGGSTVRTLEDAGGIQWPAGVIAYPTTVGTPDVLQLVTPSSGLPVQPMATSLQKKYVKSSAVAAGGSTNLDSTQITSGKTGKLYMVRVGSSVPIKVSLYTVLNGTASTDPVDEGYGWEGDYLFLSPHPGFVTVAEDATVGLDGFRVVAVNLDVSLAADISAVFFWDEV